MNSKMYASLEEHIQKWLDKWAESSEWEKLDFWCPDNVVENMSKSAAHTFDVIVSASQEAEEQTKL